MIDRWVRRGVRFAMFAVMAVIVVGFVTMSLWNWLVPPIFSGPEITFWQALGLLILSRILLGGWRAGPRGRMPWRRRMMDRWQQMTPEQREKFREAWGARCGGRSMPGSEANPAA